MSGSLRLDMKPQIQENSKIEKKDDNDDFRLTVTYCHNEESYDCKESLLTQTVIGKNSILRVIGQVITADEVGATPFLNNCQSRLEDSAEKLRDSATEYLKASDTMASVNNDLVDKARENFLYAIGNYNLTEGHASAFSRAVGLVKAAQKNHSEWRPVLSCEQAQSLEG